MVQCQDSMLDSPAFISWKRLQLSKAKLKASSKTSALLSGFAMVAMVEMQFNQPSKSGQNGSEQNNTTPSTIEPESGPPVSLLIAFAVCTTLLVSVHMLALMISTCILPNMEAISNLHNVNLVHESPHEKLHWYIEMASIFSTLLGLLLFLLEIAILCWIKFYDARPAAWAASVILIPVFIVFSAFAIHFYRILAVHKYEVTASDLQKLELLKEQMESTDYGGQNRKNVLQDDTHIV